MRLLALQDLGKHIATDRFRQKAIARTPRDSEEPRQHEEEKPNRAWKRPQRKEPSCRTVDSGERAGPEHNEHQYDWSLEQHPGCERRPKDCRYGPRRLHVKLLALLG